MSSDSREVVSAEKGPARVDWIDCARAVCVILVVVHHVVRQFVEEANGNWEVATRVWSEIDFVLTPIRIPLFFLISGLLAGRSLAAAGLGVRKRYIVPLYLYVVWSVLLAGREFVSPPGEGEAAHGPVAQFFAQLMLVCSGYWYLCALPLYFLIARVTRNVGLVFLLPPLVALYLLRDPMTDWFVKASDNFTDSPSLIGSIVANIAFFVFGARCRPEILTFSRRDIGWLVKAAGIALYGVSVWLVYKTEFSGVSLLASVVGIAVGIALAVDLARGSWLRRILNPIGARTLPVYVLQFFFVSVLSFIWSKFAQGFLEFPIVFGWAYPLLTVLFIVSASLFFFELCQRSRLRYLFEPPSFLLGAR